MAAFFHHRKLMPDSTNLTQLCAPVCDILKNPHRLCTIKSCAQICPLICPPPPFMDFFPFPPIQSPPPPPPYIPNHHSKLSSTLKISIAFLLTTFSIFVLYTLYKFYTVWARSRRHHVPNPDQIFHDHDQDQDFLDEDHGPVLDHPIWYIRTIGLQPSVISAITIVRYKKGEGLVEGTDCSICLTEFQEDETLRLLPKCSHAFHIPCIDTWLSSHTNCPLCRAGIASNLGVVISLEEPVVENPSLVEETHVETSINDVELEGEREDGSSELRIGSEDENGIMSKLEMGSNSMMRRSVSLDALSAARISAEIGNAHPGNSDGDLGTKLDKADQLALGVVSSRAEPNCSSCSIARSLQRGPDFVRRSLSCSGKVLFSRQSR